MRWILASSLFIAVCAVAPGPQLDSVYQDGQEYIYRYNSQVLTGVPIDDQYSGFKIDADARIQFTGQTGQLKVKLKLENVVIYKIHTNLGREIVPSGPVPENLLEVITSTPQGEILLRELAKSCKFSLNDGRVEDLTVEDDEPYWSTNFKKGLVHLLQVNLRDGELGYTVAEEDILGKCDSHYTLEPRQPWVRVTKVRDLDTCVQKPIVETGIVIGIQESQNATQLIDPMVHADFVAYVQGKSYAIRNAQVKSTFAFIPTESETNSMVTYTWQKISLLKVQPISSEINADGCSKELKSLIYTVPSPLMPNKYERKSYESESSVKTEERVSMVDKLLTKIADDTRSQYLPASVPSDVIELSEMLRSFSPQEFATLLRKYNCKQEECTSKLNVLYDVLPSLPTEAAAEIVLTVIRERMVVGVRASIMVNTIALTAQPTPGLTNKCLQVYKSLMDEQPEDRLVTRALLLCVGTLADRLVIMQQKTAMFKDALKPVLRNLYTELRSLLSSARSAEEKIRILKAIGNFGEASFLPELKSICEDKKAPVLVRTQSIYAMRKIAQNPQAREQVLDLVMELYMDTKEDVRVRTAAFLMVIQCRPAYSTLETIGHKLETEPSGQIKTLVYSVFLKLADSYHEESWINEVAVSIRRCLKWITPVEVLPWDTHMMSGEFYSEMGKIGGALQSILVKSPRSMLPEGLVGYLKGTIFGQTLDIIEIGIDTEGLENLVKRILNWLLKDGEKTITSIMSVLSERKEQSVRGSYIAEELHKILSKLPTEEMSDEEFKAMMYIKIQAQELQFFTINKQDIQDLISQQDIAQVLRTLVEGHQIQLTKIVSIDESSRVVPSPVGVPVYVNMTAVHCSSIMLNVNFEGVSSLLNDVISGRTPQLGNMKLKIQATYSAPTTVTLKMGSHMNFIKTGVATKMHTRVNVPLKAELAYDTNNNKLVYKWDLPQKRVDLVKLHIKPLTFVYLLPSECTPSAWHREHLIEEKTLRNPVVGEAVSRASSLPLMIVPVSVNIESKLISGRPKWVSLFPLLGEQEISVILNKQGVRSPTIRTEVNLSDLPKWAQCSEEASGNYRTGRRSSQSLNSGLSEFRPDEIFAKTCPVVRLPFTITNEDRTSTRIDMSLYYVRSPDNLLHQAYLACSGKSLLDLPRNIENIAWSTNAVVDARRQDSGKPVMKWSIGFGVDKADENKVTMQVYTDAPENVFTQGHSSYDKYPQAYKYTLAVEHTQINDVIKKAIFNVEDIVEPWVSMKLRNSNLNRILLNSNEVKCYLKVVPEFETCYFVAEVPSTGEKYSTKLPWTIPYFRPLGLNQPYSLSVPPYNQKMTHFQKISNYGKCLIEESTLTTFDGKTLLLPRVFSEPNCEMLVARDSSKQRLFTLTMEPTDKTGQKNIKLIVPEYKIEVTPQVEKHWFSWTKTVDLQVRVNDEEVSMKPSRPLVLDSKESPQRETVCKVSQQNEKVNIVCKKVGIAVAFDGFTIKVDPSYTYQGQLRGLCSNYNMDASDDVKPVHISREESLKKHFLDNIIKSDKCRAQGL